MLPICRTLSKLVAFVAAMAEISLAAKADIQRVRLQAGERSLWIEFLRDDMVHFELGETADSPTSERNGIYSTPMVFKKDYAGPSSLRRRELRSNPVFETPSLRVTVEKTSLCTTVRDLRLQRELLRTCGDNLDQATKQLWIDPRGMTHAYGLGNFFRDPGTADGDWSGHRLDVRGMGRGYGNVRQPFHGAAPSMSQFPIVYALGAGRTGFALFYDTPYGVNWSFENPSGWTAQAYGDQLRWYVLTGPSLPDLRRDFMELTGKPPVPPKSVFGLWVSKFGYGSWDEIREELRRLREGGYPIDGFALDLQWFGGRFGDNSDGRMGTLSFDPLAFADPAETLRRFREQDAIRFMPIEESYVDDRLSEHSLLRADAEHCYLSRAREPGCEPASIRQPDGNPWWWWGRGGMIDWSNPEGGLFWHNLKRMRLARMGITSHWTDLGEPEMFEAEAFYRGLPGLPGKNRHGDVHNLYNLFWLDSIHRGYRDPSNQSELARALGLPAGPRYFAMSRAGAPGLQRLGAGLWSGDIGRNMGSLRAHLNTQMHLSLAGVDYYNSDVGGFTKTNGVGHESGHSDSELYTQWFADSALGEIPLRPHGWAYGGDNTSYAPDQKGDPASNLANLRLRYQLMPYVYSLAHLAHEGGEPIFPPPVYHFQDDPNVRRLGNVKMIGPSLLYGIVAGFGQAERRVYLPKGKWIDFHSGQWLTSAGQESAPIPLYRDRPEGRGLFTLPLFAREGAIVPLRHVDERTLGVAERRKDGTVRDETIVRVFPSETATRFTLTEDDGESLAYESGARRQTVIRQLLTQSQAQVTVEAASGSYQGASSTREVLVEWVPEQDVIRGVSLGGAPLPHCASRDHFEHSSKPCWFRAGAHSVLTRSGKRSVDERLDFRFELSTQR